MMNRIKALTGVLLLLFPLCFSSCSKARQAIPETPRQIKGLTFEERVPLTYADQFAIDRYENGYSMISVADGASYLIVPEGGEIPGGLDKTVKIIRRPVGNLYLAATAVMAFFDALDSCDAVSFSGTKAEDWYIDSAKSAMESGRIRYAGKYREPDYELLLQNNCPLSIQSTMIEHTPEVKEKLTELGITVFVDYSSYEAHPIGRSEWIKVYGELLGKPDEARRLFDEQATLLENLGEKQDTGKTVVFFYITESGQIITRKSGDYVSKMIALAGGKNAFENLGDGGGTSTVKMEMEQFYASAKDADIVIYNNDIGKDVSSLEDLIAKNQLLADFKAVKNGDVWCTRENIFQETMKIGEIIADFNAVFSGTAKDTPPQYLYRLESEETP